MSVACESSAPTEDSQTGAAEFPIPEIDWNPRGYICYRTTGALVVDGRLDEPAWAAAEWTRPFVDIRGELNAPAPRHLTRVKMLWDDSNLYLAAAIDEPDVHAALTQRDSVIFHDNDFEQPLINQYE